MKKILLSIIYFLAYVFSIQAQVLYATTFYGGNNDTCVIFSFDPFTSTYARLKDFYYTNGSNPIGSLLKASDGKFYGMTFLGGSHNASIFSFDLSTSTFNKLVNLDKYTGYSAYGSLIQATDGKPYGMTQLHRQQVLLHGAPPVQFLVGFYIF